MTSKTNADKATDVETASPETETESAPRNLWQRISDIRAAIPRLAKDVEVKDGMRYKATSHDAITTAVRALLSENGVAVFQSLINSELNETGSETKYGSKMMRYSASYLVSFINIDAPDERESVTVEAHALDTGDKAPGKAMSYALKYALSKTFSIVTGDDEEIRAEAQAELVKSAERLTEGQQADLLAKADELFGDDSEEILANMCKLYLNVPKIADIQQADFARTLAALDKKKAQLEKEKTDAAQN